MSTYQSKARSGALPRRPLEAATRSASDVAAMTTGPLFVASRAPREALSGRTSSGPAAPPADPHPPLVVRAEPGRTGHRAGQQPGELGVWIRQPLGQRGPRLGVDQAIKQQPGRAGLVHALQKPSPQRPGHQPTDVVNAQPVQSAGLELRPAEQFGHTRHPIQPRLGSGGSERSHHRRGGPVRLGRAGVQVEVGWAGAREGRHGDREPKTLPRRVAGEGSQGQPRGQPVREDADDLADHLLGPLRVRTGQDHRAAAGEAL